MNDDNLVSLSGFAQLYLRPLRKIPGFNLHLRIAYPKIAHFDK